MFGKSSAYGIRPRLFAVQGSLGLEHGICGLATNPVYILVKLIHDAWCRQTVEPLAQKPLILLPRVGPGKCPSLKFGQCCFEFEAILGAKVGLRGAQCLIKGRGAAPVDNGRRAGTDAAGRGEEARG